MLKIDKLLLYNIRDREASRNNLNCNCSHDSNCQEFYEKLYSRLQHSSFEICLCQLNNYDNASHKGHLNKSWQKFCEQVTYTGKEVFETKSQIGFVVPSWNNFVDEYYDATREAFLGWRQAGSPREGPIALHMRRSRARFKQILKGCKKRDEELRAEALAHKYRNESIKDFWGGNKFH